MPDPFTPCPHRNGDDVPCWLNQYHRGPCEVHPMDRKKTSQTVWRPMGGAARVASVVDYLATPEDTP